MSSKVALVTGASSGIGEAAALELHARGFTVYGAARRVERMSGLAERGVRTIAMDVTDEDSMRAGVDRIVAETGRIDVLVNNAGYGSYGPVEEVALEEARHQFEVNVFGAARLTQLVLPHMRSRRHGRIINITSMGGKIHTPLGAWYHGTKFALEGFSDSLRMEVRPFGVDVVIVEPGAIRTEWSSIAAGKLRKLGEDSAYAGQIASMAGTLESDSNARRSSSPSVVARAIGRAATSRRPRTRYAVGMGAKPLIMVRRILPDRAYDALVARAMGSLGA
ncbi:oxidoreductase [Streptomyces tirandamycinicus]|uniref:Short-chain dehydrogenase/reductase n=1 Tax=Streptomyces tirandamycinicus TaxID=2174846 RepID=A0A2S1SZ20_9ACTN|nr:oxidoreductase [Streptomyces tirandamycinicus]AWI31606.1 short-chain dehydrogenase/reductase [Streptomyces tirandamycinicus]